MSQAELIDLNPESVGTDIQLRFDGDQFDIVRDMAASGAITLVSFDLSDREISEELAEALVVWAGTLKRSSSWWIGDLLNELEARFPESFAQIAAASGLSEQTLLGFKFVCAAVPKERRKANLGYSHHARVARMTPKEQKAWLDKASKNGWPYDVLAENIKAKRREERPQLPGVEDANGSGPNQSLIVEVAEAILRDAQEHADDPNLYVVPVEDIVRLRAAFGMEDA
jgi:hypothetical protein